MYNEILWVSSFLLIMSTVIGNGEVAPSLRVVAIESARLACATGLPGMLTCCHRPIQQPSHFHPPTPWPQLRSGPTKELRAETLVLASAQPAHQLPPIGMRKSIYRQRTGLTTPFTNNSLLPSLTISRMTIRRSQIYALCSWKPPCRPI